MFRSPSDNPKGGRSLRALPLVMIVASVIAASTQIASPQSAEPLEDYLERHSLDVLLATKLEADFGNVGSDDRKMELAERLAILYSRLLDQSDSNAQRLEWEQASRDLLEQVPRGRNQTLELTIHKAGYLRAERLAEQWRLRAIGRDQRLSALRIMAEIASSLTDNARTFRERADRLSNKVVETGSKEAVRVAQEIEEAENLASQSTYYAAWALYYRDWLSDSNDGVREALELFARILQSGGAQPDLAELPVSLLRFEHIARSALGVALCYSLDGRRNLALSWLDAIDDDELIPRSVTRQLPAYRLSILFSGHEPDYDAIDLYVAELEQGGKMSTTLARLLAVLSLDASRRSAKPRSRQLAGRAITRLADMGALRHILDIADQFDLNMFGDDSFAVAYVLALKAYERARAEHGARDPTTDAQLIASYGHAEQLLIQAIGRRDASSFGDAVANARLLLAWDRYFQSRFVDAARDFALVAPSLGREQSETAMWMRIVSLDRLNRIQPSASTEEALQTAMKEFVASHPSSRRAGRVKFRQAAHQIGPPTLERVRLLLEIPRGTNVYDEARHEAERMLYALFRRARGMEKIEMAHRYLGVVKALLLTDQRAALSPDASQDVQQRFLLRARRALDVELTRGVSAIQDARFVLDRLETAATAGILDLSNIQTELAYRRFQIRILTGEFRPAADWCDQLWQRDPGNPFALSATRDLFAYALQDWRAFPNDEDVDLTLRRVLDYGARLMDAIDGGPDLEDPDTMALVSSVAEAARVFHERTGDLIAKELSETWYAELLEARPSNHAFVVANAHIAEARGEPDQALAHWRTALGGLDDKRIEWFEAKYYQIKVLSQLDRLRARAVMRQHELLHPGYGPEPWGDLLAELAAQLAEEAAGSDAIEEPAQSAPDDGREIGGETDAGDGGEIDDDGGNADGGRV